MNIQLENMLEVSEKNNAKTLKLINDVANFLFFQILKKAKEMNDFFLSYLPWRW